VFQPRAIVDAAATGEYDVESARTLLGAIADATRIAEFDDLSRRLAIREGRAVTP
jgi:hypothetical protein